MLHVCHEFGPAASLRPRTRFFERVLTKTSGSGRDAIEAAKALGELREGVKATKRLLLERCEMRPTMTVSFVRYESRRHGDG